MGSPPAARASDLFASTRNVRKILVVDLGFLGDTVHLVPTLWNIQDAYPETELHVLTSPVGTDVLRLVSCVTRAWSIELYPEKSTLGEQWRVLRGLRRERFGLAFNFSGSDRTIFMTALSGARWRVGHPSGRWHFWNRWLIPHWTRRQDPDTPVFEQRRQVLADCGVPLGPMRFDLQLEPASKTWAAETIPPGAIHVSVNAGKCVKEWPLEHYAALFQGLWAEQPKLVVLASGSSRQREQGRLGQLVDAVKDSRLQVLPNTLTIPRLAAVLARCRLHIGGDSGVLHLAAALGVRTVSFFREQGVYRCFMPTGALHRTISVPCQCIDDRNSPCEKLGRAECLASIEPARVLALVREALQQTESTSIS